MTHQPRAARVLPAWLSRSWRETPSVASEAALRWTTVSFYLLGGAVLLVGSSHLGPGAQERRVAAVAAVAIVVGAAVVAVGHRLPRWSYHLLALLGTALVSVLVLLGRGGPASVALSAPYLFVIVNTVFLFPLWQSVVHVVVTEVACMLSMSAVGASAGDILVVQGCTIGMAVVVAWLARAASAAEEDALTGLVNRRGFDRRLEDLLRSTGREGGQVTLAVLDVDHFKQVNDTRGHAAGDRLLLACARAWRRLVPEGGTLARYGGDEFAVLLPGVPLGTAADLADELRRVTPAGVSVSAGVAAWRPSDSGSMLMNRADVALYQAKSGGRDRTVAYGDPHRAASELESAIARGELELHYQPVVQLSTGEVVGFEALARWQHPEKGLLLPASFIPQAERTGAIHSLGAWALGALCRTLMTASGPRMSVGLNVSAAELRRPDYADLVCERLAEWSMPGDLLVVEVTEGAFEDDDPHVLDNLRRLRDHGVLVAVDDFGSGYSSLRRIEFLPIDIIKLDGALVDGIKDDSDEAPILEAIRTIGRALGVRLVAERVETAHQADVLRKLGYDLAQGYYFGRPQPRPPGHATG